MEKYVQLFANWRIHVCAVVLISALVLITGMGDSLLVGFAGALLFFVGVAMAKMWHRAGKLPELDNFEDE